MSIDKISLDKMSVDEMYVDEMPVGKISAIEIVSYHQNPIIQCRLK